VIDGTKAWPAFSSGRDKRAGLFMNAIFFGRIIDAASARTEE